MTGLALGGSSDPVVSFRSMLYRLPLARRGALTIGLVLVAIFLVVQTAFPSSGPFHRRPPSPGFHDFDEAQYSMPLLHEHEEEWDLSAHPGTTSGKDKWWGLGSGSSGVSGKPLVLVTGGAGQLGTC